MNRKDFQMLSRLRLREAEYLLGGEQFSGAYYLAGYSIECALKACIAGQTARYDFPDKQRTLESYTHDPSRLLKAAGLEIAMRAAVASDLQMESNWSTVCLWSETSRYGFHTEADARRMMEAVADKGHGVLPWLIQRW